jgi:hypothetical protein
MIPAFNNKGKVGFAFYQNSMNASRLIDFMARLIRDPGRKACLILDNPSPHHTKDVAQGLKKKPDRAFLPFCLLPGAEVS